MARTIDGLVNGVTYIFKEDGTVNWRAMIKKEYLTINRQYEKILTEKLKKDFSEITIDEVEDRHLLILLQGLKELANLFESIGLMFLYLAILSRTSDLASSRIKILKFISNFF